MNNIKTADYVREWARMILEAKGEKYTPLSKGDQFEIARFILEGDEMEKGDGSKQPPPQEETSTIPPSPTAVGTTDEKPQATPADSPTIGYSSSSGGKPTTATATMMRSYALHHAGFTVQQAYDKFLEWSKEHPKEATVMDFSTGVKSANAAFAYWLAEIISVEVPTSVRTIQ